MKKIKIKFRNSWYTTWRQFVKDIEGTYYYKNVRGE